MAHKKEGDCPVATGIFIRKQAERQGVSINKMIGMYAEEADRSIGTIQSWVYPRKSKVETYPTPKSPRKQTKPEVKSQLATIAKAIKDGDVSDDDIKVVGDTIADVITEGKAAVRVGTKVVTAIKKQRKASAKGGATNRKTNLERLEKHIMSAAEGLTFLADGEIKPENEDDKISFRIIRKAAPTFILQYARLGIDVVETAEFAMIHCKKEGDTIDVKQLKSANVGH